MGAARIFVSHNGVDQGAYDYQVAMQLIDELHAAHVEVILDDAAIADSDYLPYLVAALSDCQYAIVVLTPEAVRSPRISMMVNTASGLVLQGCVKAIFQLVAVPYPAEAAPSVWTAIKSFDASRDAKRAIKRLLIEVGLVGTAHPFPRGAQPGSAPAPASRFPSAPPPDRTIPSAPLMVDEDDPIPLSAGTLFASAEIMPHTVLEEDNPATLPARHLSDPSASARHREDDPDQPAPFPAALRATPSVRHHTPLRYRGLITAGIILLVLFLVATGLFYALPYLSAPVASKSNRPATTPAIRKTATPSVRPATSALISITPVSKMLKHTYAIDAVVGTPDASKNQISARVLTTQAENSQQVSATGRGTTPATPATGIVTFQNCQPNAVTIPAGREYPVPYYDAANISVITDATVTVASGSCGATPTVYSYATVSAHTVETGAIANFPADALTLADNVDGFWVYNTQAFSGGQDARNYTYVQQSDINNAANSLASSLIQNAQDSLQGEILPAEKLVAAPHCTSSTTSSSPAGAKVSSVVVTVSVTCKGEVYDTQAALSMGTNLLQKDATASGYAVSGTITTSITGTSLIDQSGTLSISLSAAGQAVFQFSDAQKQNLISKIVGKNKDEAMTILSQQPGVSNVQITLNGGDGITLPLNSSAITLVLAASS